MSNLKRTYSITVDAELAEKIQKLVDSGKEENFTEFFRKSAIQYIKEIEKEK